MTQADAAILPYLFLVLFILIFMNLIISFSLYFVSRIKNVKILSWFWVSLLGTFFFQGAFQGSEMGIMLSFSVTIVPDLILVKIMTDSLGKKYNFKKYLTFWAIGVAGSFVLKASGHKFEIAALPMCITIFFIICGPAFYAVITNRKATTANQKLIGIIYIVGAIHTLNFAFFRMQPGAQLWGWCVSLGYYQIISICLFSFAIEEYSKKEKQRLQELVLEKTEELTRTLQVKDSLFKIVIHDIANPVQGLNWLVSSLKRQKEPVQEISKRMERLTGVINNVIKQVYSIEALNSGDLQVEIHPVNLQDSLNDLKLIFDGKLSEKQLNLVVQNELPLETSIMANQTTFTTSVMCNLISNAIKFSLPNKELFVRSYLKDRKVIIEIEDQGVGMPGELALAIFDPTVKRSRPGTLGEEGTGYGMPLVKSFMDRFNGKIEIESRPMDKYPENHGTKVTLTLGKH